MFDVYGFLVYMSKDNDLKDAYTKYSSTSLAVYKPLKARCRTRPYDTDLGVDAMHVPDTIIVCNDVVWGNYASYVFI